MEECRLRSCRQAARLRWGARGLTTREREELMWIAEAAAGVPQATSGPAVRVQRRLEALGLAHLTRVGATVPEFRYFPTHRGYAEVHGPLGMGAPSRSDE